MPRRNPRQHHSRATAEDTLTEFRFKWSYEPAEGNLAILCRYALDLGAALRVQPLSAVTPGSQFCPPESLAPLPSANPSWPRFLDHITEGAEFPLRAISDTDRLGVERTNLARGNHKSAQGHQAKLTFIL